MENVCTLGELESTWSLDDVMRANALLDMRAHYENKKMSATKKGIK